MSQLKKEKHSRRKMGKDINGSLSKKGTQSIKDRKKVISLANN